MHCGCVPVGSRETLRQNLRVSWDEATIALHRSWAGIQYGQMRMREIDTPFVRYDSRMSRDEQKVIICDRGRPELVESGAKIDITDLQTKLGILSRIQEQNENLNVYQTPEVDPVKRENQRRREAGVLLRQGIKQDDDDDDDDD
jgi:hypothetical protein